MGGAGWQASEGGRGGRGCAYSGRVTKTWRVEPSGPLRGDIAVRGSKNAVTKHMVAAMLGDGPSTIRNAPEVGDVDITAAMLEAIGFQVSRSGGDVTVAPNGPRCSQHGVSQHGVSQHGVSQHGESRGCPRRSPG